MNMVWRWLAVMVITGTVEAASLEVSTIRGWTIVVAEDAIPSERYAAEEFRAVFETVSGKRLEISNRANPSGNVLIGPGAAAMPVGDLGPEGLRIHITEKNLAIAGGRPRGTLYGVYEFFETFLGVRFLTADHTYVPAGAKDLKLKCNDFTYIPPFEFRWSYFWETGNDGAFAAKLRTNTVSDDPRFGGRSGQQLISHSFNEQVPIGTYGKDHPEYFLMKDGRRRTDLRDAWAGGPNICYADPAVLNIPSPAVYPG